MKWSNKDYIDYTTRHLPFLLVILTLTRVQRMIHVFRRLVVSEICQYEDNLWCLYVSTYKLDTAIFLHHQ